MTSVACLIVVSRKMAFNMRSCQTQLWRRPKTYANMCGKNPPEVSDLRILLFLFHHSMVLKSVLFLMRVEKVKVLRTNVAKNKFTDLSGSRCNQLIQNKITRATNKFNLFRASLHYLLTGTEKYFHISFCRVPC